jgi:hypothetical protein
MKSLFNFLILAAEFALAHTALFALAVVAEWALDRQNHYLPEDY